MSEQASVRTPTYRVARSRGMDPATRRLALIATILGGAFLAVVGAWSLIGHRHHGTDVRIGANEVPVIEPPPGPMRVKPTNPGGMQLSAAEQDLFGGTGDGGQEKLAPAPETPDPAALQPPAPPPSAAAPSVTAASAPAPAPAQAASPMAAPATATAPIPAPVAPPAPAPQTAPAVAAVPPPATNPTGHFEVQLAALPTEQAAKDEWALLQRKLPDLKGRSPSITSADVNGKTWYRLRTGGFADPAAAKAFCDQARGKGLSCDVPRA